MAEQAPLVTIHLINQTSYIATVEDFESFMKDYDNSLSAEHPTSLLKIRLMTPGEDVSIDTTHPFEAYLNPNAIALVDYI